MIDSERAHFVRYCLYVRNSRGQDGAHRERRRDHAHGGERILRDRDVRVDGPRTGARRHGLLALHEELRAAVRAAQVLLATKHRRQ